MTSERQQREKVPKCCPRPSPPFSSASEMLQIVGSISRRNSVQQRPATANVAVSVSSSQGACPCFISAEEHAKQISGLYYEDVDRFQA